MTNAQQREAARQFANIWRNKGYEKGDTHTFWIALLHNVLGMERTTEKITFEKIVTVDGQTKFIDAYIVTTKVLIEQKSDGKDLNKPIKQSGGIPLTPYQQARRYAQFLPHEENPRWIVTCNFKEFHIYDMNKPTAEPEILLLENLQNEFYRLDFLVDKQKENVAKQTEVSIQAGEIVGKLYDALLKQYKDPSQDSSLKSLNALCVRLVFCLYSEDSGIFGRREMFHDYLMRYEARDVRRALQDLFHVLNTKPEDRDPYLDADLAEFPYVNGELFAEEYTEIPMLTDEIRNLILNKASADFDWSDISPTIFGAVFESTLNPETRRSGGMHYTSIENIHKVIDPLFLDGLIEELKEIKGLSIAKTKKDRLDAFQNKLASLSWLDPACGSGNFLTESYISIRRLENEVIKARIELQKKQVSGQIVFGDLGEESSPIKVSIEQFYGIEINDFAVTVGKTALWIAESQMMKETEDVVHMNLDFLPLESHATIVEGNALRMDWNIVIDSSKLNYIMGNPPFIGARLMGTSQKDDMLFVFEGIKNIGNLDYVTAWYWKAMDYIKGTNIKAAFVSTNSVSQGEQVAILWKPLLEKGIQIDFAYRTFKWGSEAKEKAAVHCVIVGFGFGLNENSKRIFACDGTEILVKNINPYLVDAPSVLITSRSKAICDVPAIGIGNMPIDGGNYLFTKEEKDEFLQKEPQAQKWFRPWVGSQEFINRFFRYCLWLKECPPSELRKMPESMKRVDAVQKFRQESKRVSTKKIADFPLRFQTENFPESNYIVIPEVSSERRRYVPMGFLTPDILCSNLVKIVSNASLFHFGILTSNVHNAWIRAVGGRLKSDYRYSKDIIYNNFPWPDVTIEQRKKIEETAQSILDARNIYPESSLADLYDPLTMPSELRKAHQQNDKAVMQAYGFSVKDMSESDCVANLMELYQAKTEL